MKRFALAFSVLSSAAMFAAAQNKAPIDPPEIVTMREEHLRAMQRAAVPVLTAYARALEAQKLVFARQGNADGVVAVDNELKEVARQLQAADKASAKTGAVMQLTILSATYGSSAKKRTTDITRILRKAIESGATTIKLNTTEGAAGVDPAPYTPKETVINYTINGERKQKSFPEGRLLNFKDDLQ